MDDVETAVRSRLIVLTKLIPSISPWNVWDLPVWAWRGYAAFVDDHIREANKR